MLAAEVVALLLRGQLAVDEEVRRLEVGRVRDVDEILDVEAAVAQDPGLAVDEGDRRLARPGVDEAVVEGDEPGLGAQLRDVDGALALGADDDGQLVLALTMTEDSRLLAHRGLLELIVDGTKCTRARSGLPEGVACRGAGA